MGEAALSGKGQGLTQAGVAYGQQSAAQQQNMAQLFWDGLAPAASLGAGYGVPIALTEIEVEPISGPMDAVVKNRPRKLRVRE